MTSYVNEAWRTQSGHPRDKDLSLWLDSVADHHKPYLQQIYNELFLEKKASSWEWQWANGTWSFCQAVIISSHTQSLVGTICVLTDVTNQKRIEEERKQNLLRAEAAKREADDKKRHQEFLVSVVSHEVRNPVSAILQCAGLCKSNLTFIRTALNSGKAYFPTSELINLIDEDVDALESIHQMALSQERIANDVLSLGKIQLESLEIFATDVNLPDECRKIISVFEGECRMKQIRISLDLVGELAKPDGQHIYLTDPVRFGQIAINLISNGIRFTDKASMHRREISVSIEVASAAPDDDSCRPPKTSVPVTPGSSCYIYGAVTDSGPGLTPEELTRLFQRFSQASSSTHAVYGGSGLGLYVCRMITSLMNGRINVESVKGEGSTFRFFIKADAPLSFQHPLKPVFASSVTTKVVQLHILVVEDNQINQKVLRRQLMKAGLTCECADDGKMALDLIVASHTLGNKTFDAILMDQEMPVMDGITSVTHIRKMEDDGIIPKRVPIFALTGNARKEQIERMLEVGMDDVIIKPYRINALLDKLCTLTSRQSSLHCHASSKQQQ
ncbi:two-component-like hybrid sensor histidine kinase 2 [Phaffia rhodozyma]|uniref:Two-component-like hybrid sensor histidine kinase 2 n=1 Tax=Phaffia rhodozyma TaxID=264483 RepID=A0A0F7SSF5_PHARH|nr:two-component-like hybrid sensor histidine kinase 2 [Phaffia rhodozyma]